MSGALKCRLPAVLASAVLALALALLAGRAAHASPPPLPPLRPTGLGETVPAPDRSIARPPASPASCLDQLRSAGVMAEPAEQPGPGKANCQIDDPVRLAAFALPGGRPVAFADRPVLACRFAVAFAAWSAGAAATVASQKGTRPAAIRTGPGWDCRGRNRQVGAKMSAHATGIAIDVSGFELPDRTRLEFSLATRDDPALRTVRSAACNVFTTVLGPGSDPFHHSHLHVDAQQHGRDNRFKICQ